jgi:hypothetical protein
MRAAVDCGEPYGDVVLGDVPSLESVEAMFDLLGHIVGEKVWKAADYGLALFHVLGCHGSDGHEDITLQGEFSRGHPPAAGDHSSPMSSIRNLGGEALFGRGDDRRRSKPSPLLGNRRFVDRA